MSETNGSAPRGGDNATYYHADLIDRLELTYDRATDRLEIGGKAISDEVILAMLRRAVFTYEMKVRAAIAAQLAEQIHQQQRDAALAQSIARGTRQ